MICTGVRTNIALYIGNGSYSEILFAPW